MKDEDRTRKQLIAELFGLRRQLEQTLQTLDQEVERRVAQKTDTLEKMCEELRRLDMAKDRFLSSVTHELRTPLTSIRSFAEILLEYPDEPVGTRKEFSLIIKKESERLSRLIDDFLDLSKIRAGKIQWHMKKLNCEPVIQKAVESVRSLMRKGDLSLVTQIDEGLPPFRADEDRIIQVLTNLLGNAIKYTPQRGEIRIYADLQRGRRVEDRRDFIHIAVSDTGIGISTDEISTIFEDYIQGRDTINDTSKGTGLGLPICREIVLRHSGNIWVESEKGKGSTFHFTLPVELPRINSPRDEAEQSSLSDQREQYKSPLR